MQMNNPLYNAVVVGENPEAGFIVEGNRLHAVEKSVAELKKDKSKSQVIVPLMQEGYEALRKFAEGKVPRQFTDPDKAISLKPSEQEQYVEKIHNIFTHLAHHDRNELSSLIHHKKT